MGESVRQQETDEVGLAVQKKFSTQHEIEVAALRFKKELNEKEAKQESGNNFIKTKTKN